ncbi:acetyl esterase/lipase [Kribbella aluminosa]|uniref:Acetyl esterase/lipase n=1 Tax=Kribbella aluminosa TaxID=416017 RepID=A0ABS4UHE9_9ACTN|nr:alpha/beta hydrolase [Kribbella aluminosa]MBP2351072.1 acetyl esterase/lipase [Kribbella aluminosa]
MASKESDAVRRHWEAARTPSGDQVDRELADHRWAELTAEPDHVDYLAVPDRPALWIVPHDATTDRVLLCLHGGGYIGGSRYSHRKLFAHLAKAVGARALVFDYSLAPERIHPVQVDEAVDTYRWLLDQGIAPEHIVFAGDSAGGGMAITTQLRARAAGLPLPAGALPFSPWINFEANGATYDSNRDRDAFFHRDLVRGLARIFLGPDGSPRDPNVNPTYGDLTGLGPIYIQVGGDEVLLDDARQLAEAAEKAGVDVRLDVFAEMQHTFQMAAGRAPEADDAISRMGQWGRKVLGL